LRAARSALAAAGALAVLVVLAALPVATAAPAAPGARQSPAIELVSQTPVAVPGRPFTADVLLPGIPADGSITLEVHQRIRSRSELAQSMEGNGLRCCIYTQVTPISDLAPRAGGARRISLNLAPAPGGLPLPTEGVYPVELTAKDATSRELATLVTHLIAPPERGDDAPNLAVAVVAELGLPTALQPDGTVDLDPRDVAGLQAIAEGLAAAPGVPATLDVRPETLDALRQSRDPAHLALVEAIRAAAVDRLVLAAPYVSLDVDALADAELTSELTHQAARGRAVLQATLGRAPDDRVQVAPPSLRATGLGALALTGATRLLVDDADVEPLATGIIRYSLAQPFVVAVPSSSDAEDRTPGDVLALSADPTVVERLSTDGPDGLVVSRVLAELALLRLEQPSVARTAVVPLRSDLSVEVVRQLVAALGTGRPFAAVTLPAAFDHAEPVLDGGGNKAERPLQPGDRGGIPDGIAREITTTRAAVGTFRSMVGARSTLPDDADRHVLVAAAADLTTGERRDHLDAANATIAVVADQVSMASTFTLTLTAREGTIPISVRNDSGVPLRVSVRLRSQKLEFPDGDTIPLVLEEETTRVDVRVRARATGAFPLIIEVRTADRVRTLASSRYTVRSTAISGVGLVASVGAGLFLVVWWARHWRRTRRSRRLIAVNGHPTAGNAAT
jgi:hypothetical protein